MLYKLVVVSDIHHDVDRLDAIIPIINTADYLIFCGDGYYDIKSRQGYIQVPIVCVRGNNDLGTNITDMASVIIGNTRVLVTHGHQQKVNSGPSGLVAVAQLKKCGVVFFGHTHKYFDREVEGVHLICPGALCNGSFATVLTDGVRFSSTQQLI